MRTMDKAWELRRMELHIDGIREALSGWEALLEEKKALLEEKKREYFGNADAA